MNCQHCNSEFSGRIGQKYCSPNCRHRMFCKSYKINTGGSYTWRKRKAVSERKLYFKPDAGVRRLKMGRKWYWFAHVHIDGMVQRGRYFPIERLGETGARLAAALQRLCWLIDLGFWRPDEDDPMAILSYTQLLRGNQDYAMSEVDDAHSPYIPESDRDAGQSRLPDSFDSWSDDGAIPSAATLNGDDE